MADFPGDIVELEETFTYELGLLEYLRQALFNESESTDQISMVFGDLTVDGHHEHTVPGCAGEALLHVSRGTASSYANGLAAGVGSSNEPAVASPISQITDLLRAPRGHSSGLPLPGLLAPLLAVGGTVLLEILSLLSGPADEYNSEYVFQGLEAHRNKIKALHKNFLFNV